MKRKEKEEEEEEEGEEEVGEERTKPHNPWFQRSQATKLFFHPTPPPCVGRHGVLFSHSVVSVFPSRELSLPSHPASTRLEKVMKGRASHTAGVSLTQGGAGCLYPPSNNETD